MHQLFWQEPSSFSEDEDEENSSSNIIRFGKLKLERVYSSPNIYVIDNFMTTNELSYCDSLIASQVKYSQSFLDNDEQESFTEKKQRTSTFVALEKQQNSQIASMERRAAELLGISSQQVEPLQLVRYREGEFFGIHHDLGILYDDGSVQMPKKQAWFGRRMATLFLYLNTVPDNCGGCTYFPECNDLRVQPKRGRAVLFCNILENGMPDPKTVHAGEAVKGNGNDKMEPVIKYGMNIWACED